MATKHQFVKISVSNLYTEKQKRAIAEDLINYIINRTQAGKGPGGKPWPGKSGQYSAAYKNSWQFRAARTATGKGKVNLSLSGNMLESIERLKSLESEENIVIGFEAGTEENAKADGNIRGTYGKESPIPGKARPFLKLTEAEIKRILSEHPISQSAKYKRALELREKAEEYAKKFSKGIRKVEKVPELEGEE